MLIKLCMSDGLDNIHLRTTGPSRSVNHNCWRNKRHTASSIFIVTVMLLLSMFLIFIWQCTFALLLCSFAALLLSFGIVAYCGIVCRHYWIVVLLTLNNLLCAYNKQLMPIKSWIIDVQFVSTSIQNILEVLSFSSVLSDVIFNCNLAILFHFQQ